MGGSQRSSPTKVFEYTKDILTALYYALHLFRTIQAASEHKLTALRASEQAIVTIKAVHSAPNASKASTDDSGGLESIICIACGAPVMLTSNLWIQAGLVNGAMGSVEAICYRSGVHGRPDLPVAVMVHFNSYHGPDGTVPIVPVCHTWYNGDVPCSRQQVTLTLAWAITIHKAEGLTLDEGIIEVGTREISSGLTFVACSRVCCLTNLFIPVFPFLRLSHLSASQHRQECQKENTRLQQLPPNNLHLLPVTLSTSTCHLSNIH